MRKEQIFSGELYSNSSLEDNQALDGHTGIVNYSDSNSSLEDNQGSQIQDLKPHLKGFKFLIGR